MSDRSAALARFVPPPSTEGEPVGGALAVKAVTPPPLVAGPLDGVGSWLEARFAHFVARFLDFGARRNGAVGAVAASDGATLTRIGGPIARWVSFPRGVRTTTALTSMAAL